jgi:hypothetical protein
MDAKRAASGAGDAESSDDDDCIVILDKPPSTSNKSAASNTRPSSSALAGAQSIYNNKTTISRHGSSVSGKDGCNKSSSNKHRTVNLTDNYLGILESSDSSVSSFLSPDNPERNTPYITTKDVLKYKKTAEELDVLDSSDSETSCTKVAPIAQSCPPDNEKLKGESDSKLSYTHGRVQYGDSDIECDPVATHERLATETQSANKPDYTIVRNKSSSRTDHSDTDVGSDDELALLKSPPLALCKSKKQKRSTNSTSTQQSSLTAVASSAPSSTTTTAQASNNSQTAPAITVGLGSAGTRHAGINNPYARKRSGNKIVLHVDQKLFSQDLLISTDNLYHKMQEMSSASLDVQVQSVDNRQWGQGKGIEWEVQHRTGSVETVNTDDAIFILWNDAHEFLQLLDQDETDESDDYPLLASWLERLHKDWQQCQLETSGSLVCGSQPRVYFLLYRVKETLESMWVDYRCRGGRNRTTKASTKTITTTRKRKNIADAVTETATGARTGSRSQDSNDKENNNNRDVTGESTEAGRSRRREAPSITTDVIQDAILWLLLRYQVDCIPCESLDKLIGEIDKITSAVGARSEASTAVTMSTKSKTHLSDDVISSSLRCIRRKKPQCNADDPPLARARDLWIRQVQQVPRVSHASALYMAESYPTMTSVWEAYNATSGGVDEILNGSAVATGNNVGESQSSRDGRLSEEEKQLLLARVWRDDNTSQRVLSHWFYQLLTSMDPHELLM